MTAIETGLTQGQTYFIVLTTVITLVVLGLIKAALSAVYNSMMHKKTDTGKELREVGAWVGLFSIPAILIAGGTFLAGMIRRDLPSVDPNQLLLLGLLALLILSAIFAFLNREGLGSIYESSVSAKKRVVRQKRSQKKGRKRKK